MSWLKNKEVLYVRLTVIRHGITAGNLLDQHIGSTDLPLIEQGMELAKKTAPFLGTYDVYYSSPMLRTRQTASLLFPGRDIIPFPGFQERDFGMYEGKSWQDLKEDPAYVRWYPEQIEAPPGGESRSELIHRCADAMQNLLLDAQKRGAQSIVLVTHGNVVMALMSHFVQNGWTYYDWLTDNCGGWVVDMRENPLSFSVIEDRRKGWCK